MNDEPSGSQSSESTLVKILSAKRTNNQILDDAISLALFCRFALVNKADHVEVHIY
jgi:hypothetical protein